MAVLAGREPDKGDLIMKNRISTVFAILFACRIRSEERMMLEQFGDEYAAYMARSTRLVPGIW
jgi:protein-S-isoprenylcysteine O-methyltransferase Ste14